MKSLITATLFCIFLISCSNYYKVNRRHHLIKSGYGKDHGILIKDAMICSYIDKLYSIQPVAINSDSIFDVFINAFRKLPCNFRYTSGKTFCNRSFIASNRFKYRLFDFTYLQSLAADEDSHVLIPLVGYFYLPSRNFYITSTGMPGGGGFSKNVHIQLAVLIFKNKELVYYKSRRFFSESVQTKLATDNIDFSIKQEHIDTLVQLTMKDYIDRMK